MNPIIQNFSEYNAHRKGKQMWPEPRFAMPRGQTECGLCKNNFFANDYFFLICESCVKRNVSFNHINGFTDFVYGLYSMSNELLYVGVTNDPVRRAHNHMLTKNFKYMKVIKQFDNRVSADDYEKYSINQLKPPLNKLYETDWTKEPLWNKEEFGIVAQKTNKTKIKKVQSKQKSIVSKKYKPVDCDICGQKIGKNNGMTAWNGLYVHKHVCRRPEVMRKANKSKKKKTLIICELCDKSINNRQKIEIKDSKGNRGHLHRGCYERRVAQIKSGKIVIQ